MSHGIDNSQKSDETLALTCSAMLATGKYLFGVNLLCFSIILLLTWIQSKLWFGIGVMFFITLLACYWQIRLSLDAKLFTALAHSVITPQQLDISLTQLKMRKTTKERSMLERCQGALKLYQKLVGITLVQVLLCVIFSIILLG